jgi:hypothetical protein
MKRILCISILLLAFSYMTACSYVRVNDDGSKYILGLVSMKIDENLESNVLAGTVIDVETVGLNYVRSDFNGGVGFGYSRNRVVGIKNHKVSCGDVLLAVEDLGMKQENCSFIENKTRKKN